MTKFEKFLVFLAFILIMLAFLPVSSFAQWRSDDYRSQEEYYDRGRVFSLIKRLENRSSEFEKRLRRELDKKRNTWQKDEYLLSLARDFKRATDELEDIYETDRNINRNIARSYFQAQRVLSLGQQIDSAIYNFSVSRSILKDWDRIREDLNKLANIYAYYNNDRTRRNRGNRSYRDYKDDDYRYNRDDRFPKKNKYPF